MINTKQLTQYENISSNIKDNVNAYHLTLNML